MRNWRLFLMVLLSSVGVQADGGNGSSGVGNSFPITDGIEARVTDDRSLVMNTSGNRIVDGKTGEGLFAVDHIDKRNLLKEDGQLVRSQMGSVDGFEHLPSSHQDGSASPTHYWLICPKGTQCLRLTPLSRTNPKVEMTIGALRSPMGQVRLEKETQ